MIVCDVAPPGVQVLPELYELVKVIVAGAQAVAELTVTVGAAGVAMDVIDTVLEVAGDPVAQPRLDVITTVAFAFAVGVYVNVFEAPAAPCDVPFKKNSKVAVPPLVGVAVRVTEDPAQTFVAEALKETEAATAPVTLIVTAFEVAGEPVLHTAFETTTQVTTSPFAGL